MKSGSNSLPARGPLLIPDRNEIVCIHDAMQDRDDAVAVSLRAKCKAVLDAHPSWREPLK